MDHFLAPDEESVKSEGVLPGFQRDSRVSARLRTNIKVIEGLRIESLNIRDRVQ